MQIAEINPKELAFLFEPTKIAHCTLYLKNLTQTPVTYKIKTTKPQMFQVKPSLGILQPEGTAIIDIQTSYALQSELDITSAKFQANFAIYEDKSPDPTSFWKAIGDAAQQKELLKSVVKQNEQQVPQQLEQSIASSDMYKTLTNYEQENPKQKESFIINKSQDQFQQAAPREEKSQYYEEQIKKLTDDIERMKREQQVQAKPNEVQEIQFKFKQVILLIIISAILGALIAR
ncbi:hypothetical protein pb186bvf_019383 [Paramecium bursaria]